MSEPYLQVIVAGRHLTVHDLQTERAECSCNWNSAHAYRGVAEGGDPTGCNWWHEEILEKTGIWPWCPPTLKRGTWHANQKSSGISE